MRTVDNQNRQEVIQQRGIVNNADNCLKDFLFALLNVEDRYLIWPYGVNSQMCERVFAYELYHQWRKLADQHEYENLVINGEIRKDGSVIRHVSLGTIYPDLILHEQQDNLNQQFIASEFKTTSALSHSKGRKQLKKDLIKLGQYITELEFQHSIFVQVLNVDDCFENSIVPYIIGNQDCFTNCDRIFYVIKEHNQIRYDTIENIINSFE